MGFSGGLKGGGGLFNGDGTLRPFTFSAIAPGDKKAGKWAYIVLAFQADGKEKVDTQHLFLGGVDQYEFEEGGDTAVSVKDGKPAAISTIGKKTPSGRFFATLVAAAQHSDIDPDSFLPDLEGGEPLNFDGINGLRVTLAQEVDVKGTASKGQREGSDGNKYDRTNTVVEAVLGEPSAKAGKPATKGGKPAVNNAARDAADALVASLIADALKANKKGGGEVPVSKFKMAVLRSTTIAKGEKDAVSKLLADEAYRNDAAERGVFTYDAEGETVAAA